MNTALKLCREDSFGYTYIRDTSIHPRGKHNSTPQISVLAFNKLAACCVQTFISYEYKAIQSRQNPQHIGKINTDGYYPDTNRDLVFARNFFGTHSYSVLNRYNMAKYVIWTPERFGGNYTLLLGYIPPTNISFRV